MATDQHTVEKTPSQQDSSSVASQIAVIDGKLSAIRDPTQA